MNDLTESERRQAMIKLINLCHANLFVGTNPVLTYLHQRGITDATINKFKIGSFPEDCELIAKFMGRTAAFKMGVVHKHLENTEITSKFITHKLIIPIHNEFGQEIAVIGRCLYGDAQRAELSLPKYINTSFKKGNCLFGLNTSRDHIRDLNQAYVVEGNFDVITAYQHGMRNVVATSGTTLTRQQLIILTRYTDNIQLMLDNDEAGQNATSKIIKKYSDLKLNIHKVKLPSDVKDLDDYFIKYKTIVNNNLFND